ncbi:hypothetical protein [Spiroplasma poulsonii]|uniref:Uncharacterized protein n=1 Tax=Spiroplasma poulsonii TaxID=2138 RepID=A0A2P6F9N8_9MOLU|nr:hypothetical protein [Spiroplasma poulsonii]PQM30177.1 hypothetical protein SMSRO_SF026490 [Spiroplasma poulsonii]
MLKILRIYINHQLKICFTKLIKLSKQLRKQKRVNSYKPSNLKNKYRNQLRGVLYGK